METKRVAKRNHGAEFKANILAACGQPGASVAAIALRNGLNANRYLSLAEPESARQRAYTERAGWSSGPADFQFHCGPAS